MKIYTLYSESHKILFENWFEKSLKETNKNYELETLVTPQVCKSGNYMDDGWLETMIHKNEFIVNSLNNSKNNEIILHCDVDVQFFKDIESNLNKSLFDTCDIFCQADGPYSACYGVMFLKNTENVKNLFNEILNIIKTVDKNNISNDNDQNIFNKIYHQFGVKVGLLDHRYYSVWRDTGGYVWEPRHGLKTQIPSDLILHHANYTVGIKNKIELMSLIKNNQNL